MAKKSEKFPTVGCKHPCLSVAVAISWASAYLKPHEDWLAELLLEAEATVGPFIYYVITFLGFLDPPPHLRKHVFSTENNQKLAISDPPPPYK